MNNTISSLVHPFGPHASYSCGYCKSSSNDLNHSWQMDTTRLTVSDYQYLIDRGWRRCGTFCYKPLNNQTCCPAYTIRCDVSRFRPSRSHKRILRTVSDFLRSGKKVLCRSSKDNSECNVPSDLNRSEPEQLVSLSHNSVKLLAQGDTSSSQTTGTASHSLSDLSNCKDFAMERGGTSPSNTRNGAVPNSGSSDRLGDTSAIPTSCGDVEPASTGKPTKARTRRWLAKQDRMAKRALEEGRSVDDLMQDYFERRAKRLEKNKQRELEDFLSFDSSADAPPKHTLEVRLVRSSPRTTDFDATLSHSLKVYQNYQQQIHKDEPSYCSKSQFIRFLVDSPLVPDDANSYLPGEHSGPTFGSYHQQYWLDNKKLIAVGVVDLLPGCLSSVYLFYDPEYAFLHLGTYSALREIAFVRDLMHKYGPNSNIPDPMYANFNSYYMGFFIRSCPKMIYKAQFGPSFLACPETYCWIPVSECLRRLDEAGSKYARFSSSSATDENRLPADLTGNQLNDRIMCCLNPESPEDGALSNCQPVTLHQIAHCCTQQGLQCIHEWAHLIGKRAVSGNFHLVL